VQNVHSIKLLTVAYMYV